MESLEPFKRDATEEQIRNVEMYIEMGFKAHLDIHCNYWLKNRFIPLEEYVDKRIRESCNQFLSRYSVNYSGSISIIVWRLVLCVVEYVMDYQMPDTIRRNPLVKEFNEKAVELALAVDDYIMAYPKIMSNDITSRVISYLKEKGCSLQEAIDEQFRYTMDLHKECKQLMDKINSKPELSSDKLKEWMKTVMNNSYSCFKVVGKLYKFEVSADQTIQSPKWQQIIEGIKTKNQLNKDIWN